ncbi:NUDIX hydrolase [Dyadobacter sediminis]|uniref:NUDIX domain-containing protein n=1 Tax=Dyadobacter sediminis TaxID=1493691 RepID=A0A5R9KFC7_9BACT|nr:NUDIX domain-containing protein [Dyadobacter sediminis]TLU94860.1 NUDIX domain-containing protein [Dyadobacter sediminis]GGB87347.1 DNA mismatch repair protein MutT [Dyadobacter sediminis]
MIDKLAFIKLQDKKILAARSKGRGIYYIPGGKREPGETDSEALAREIEEELTLKLDPASVQFYGEFRAQAHGQSEGIMVNMRCYTASGIGEIVPSAEIEEVIWLSYSDREKVSDVAKLIFDDLKVKGLLE